MSDMRKVKGMSIAKEHTIKQVKGGWIVPSQNSAKNYFVSEHDFECDCPDCKMRNLTCKHGYAVKYFLGIEKITPNGITTEKVRLTYKQAWHTYNQAQTTEVKQFEILLADLLESIDEPIREGAGRPSLSLREQLFCSVKKIYSQMSSRRAKGLFDEAKEKALIEKSPYFNVVSALLNKEGTTALLEKLITLSALPLKSVEHTWLADSSGFRTNNYSQYCQEKHGRTKENVWIKAHIVCGQKTNVISSATITASEGANTHDSTQFAPNMQATHNAGFEISTAIADKAYLSRDNFSLIDSFGGTPLIPFKSNTTGKPKGKSHVWRKMFSYFMLNQEEFYQRYYSRNNVEATFHMIKAKLGDSLKSKNFIAQKNELLCKIVAHNIMVLIQEVYELGIVPEFEPFKEKEVVENLHVNSQTCTFINKK
jgi:transposase